MSEEPIDKLLARARKEFDAQQTLVGADGKLRFPAKSPWRYIGHGADQDVYEWTHGDVVVKVPHRAYDKQLLGADSSSLRRRYIAQAMGTQAVLSANPVTRQVHTVAKMYLLEYRSRNKDEEAYLPTLFEQRVNLDLARKNPTKNLNYVPVQKWGDKFGITTPLPVLREAERVMQQKMGLRWFDLHRKNWLKDQSGKVSIFDTSRYLAVSPEDTPQSYRQRMGKFDKAFRRTVGKETWNNVLAWGGTEDGPAQSLAPTGMVASAAVRGLARAMRSDLGHEQRGGPVQVKQSRTGTQAHTRRKAIRRGL